MTAKMVYAWKEGVQMPVSAAVAGAEIERLRKEGSEFLTPAAVVEAARPKGSPLHPVFEWDDRKAAAAYRETQAGYIIRHIVVQNMNTPDVPPVRAFVSVADADNRPQYTSFSYAMAHSDLREQVLANALRDMQIFERKYSHLAELAAVVRVIKKARPQLEKVLRAA